MAQPRILPADQASNQFQRIVYLREMLGELRSVAEREGCDMLCYLLEMAYLEASEIENGRHPNSSGLPARPQGQKRRQRYK